MPRRRSSGSESVRVVPASTLPGRSITPAAYSSRSVRVVLPASTCARIPKLSVFCDTRHILRTGHEGHLDGHEHPAHLPSSTIGAVLSQAIIRATGWQTPNRVTTGRELPRARTSHRAPNISSALTSRSPSSGNSRARTSPRARHCLGRWQRTVIILRGLSTSRWRLLLLAAGSPCASRSGSCPCAGRS